MSVWRNADSESRIARFERREVVLIAVGGRQSGLCWCRLRGDQVRPTLLLRQQRGHAWIAADPSGQCLVPITARRVRSGR